MAYVTELNRLLGTRFVPGHRISSSPLGLSVQGVIEHHNKGQHAHRDFELQRIGFLVQHLKVLEQKAPDLLKHYRRELLRSGASDTFFGARFELMVAAPLLERGITPTKGERPDFTFQDGAIGIECTSARLRDKATKERAPYKIKSAAVKKTASGYATRSTALFMDITNLAHYSKPFDPAEYRAAANDCAAVSGFGAILLFISLLNRDLNRYENNYLRIDHSEISPGLLGFLNSQYPVGTHRVFDSSYPFEA